MLDNTKNNTNMFERMILKKNIGNLCRRFNHEFYGIYKQPSSAQLLKSLIINLVNYVTVCKRRNRKKHYDWVSKPSEQRRDWGRFKEVGRQKLDSGTASDGGVLWMSQRLALNLTFKYEKFAYHEQKVNYSYQTNLSWPNFHR